MKFLSVRDLKTKSSQVWQDIPKLREMIITSNGRPIALLSSVNENKLEHVLTAFRRARVANAVAALQDESVEKGAYAISLDEIDAEIKAVRSKRKTEYRPGYQSACYRAADTLRSESSGPIVISTRYGMCDLQSLVSTRLPFMSFSNCQPHRSPTHSGRRCELAAAP